MAININGVNKLVFNKTDVLETVGRWNLYSGLNIFEFTSSLDMTVLGEISAKDIQAQHSSSVTIQNSGSTTFGNTLDDNHQRTGSLILSGSFGLNGYNITSVSNDSSLSNASSTAVLTEFAAKNSFAGTTTKSQYLRKSFLYDVKILAFR